MELRPKPGARALDVGLRKQAQRLSHDRLPAPYQRLNLQLGGSAVRRICRPADRCGELNVLLAAPYLARLRRLCATICLMCRWRPIIGSRASQVARGSG
jgi:hypothetical protein